VLSQGPWRKKKGGAPQKSVLVNLSELPRSKRGGGGWDRGGGGWSVRGAGRGSPSGGRGREGWERIAGGRGEGTRGGRGKGGRGKKPIVFLTSLLILTSKLRREGDEKVRSQFHGGSKEEKRSRKKRIGLGGGRENERVPRVKKKKTSGKRLPRKHAKWAKGRGHNCESAGHLTAGLGDDLPSSG